MAQFIPAELPKEALAAEHVLFNKLRELPDSFLVLCLKSRYPHYPNFILIDNALGLIFINIFDKPLNNHIPLLNQQLIEQQLSHLRHEPSLLDDESNLNLPITTLHITTAYENLNQIPAALKQTNVIPMQEFRKITRDNEPIDTLLEYFRINHNQPTQFTGLNDRQKTLIRAAFDPATWISDFIILSDQQATVLRQINNTRGHQIISGVAGSGKTLILAALVRDILMQDPTKQILCLCFNRGPAQFLRSILKEDNGFPQGQQDNLKIDTFNHWVSQIIGSVPRSFFETKIEHFGNVETFFQVEGNREEGSKLYNNAISVIQKVEDLLDRYQRRTQNNGWCLLKYLIDGNETVRQYDAVLIDEAHIFEPHWFLGALLVTKGGVNGTFVIARDTAQSLDKEQINMYKTLNINSWSQLGIRARGRSRYLRTNFRNTQEILNLAWHMIKNQQGNLAENEDDLGGFTIPSEAPTSQCSGEVPTLWMIRTPFDLLNRNREQRLYADQVRKALDIVAHVRQEGVISSNIAILYRSRREADLNKLVQGLGASGAGCYWVNRDDEALENYSLSLPGVKLITTRTALGMEFEVVILLWLDQFDDCYADKQEQALLSRRELYVAMTRARKQLFLVASDQSKVAGELQRTRLVKVGK